MEILFYLGSLALVGFICYAVGYDRAKWEAKNGYEKGK